MRDGKSNLRPVPWQKVVSFLAEKRVYTIYTKNKQIDKWINNSILQNVNPVYLRLRLHIIILYINRESVYTLFSSEIHYDDAAIRMAASIAKGIDFSYVTQRSSVDSMKVISLEELRVE